VGNKEWFGCGTQKHSKGRSRVSADVGLRVDKETGGLGADVAENLSKNGRKCRAGTRRWKNGKDAKKRIGFEGKMIRGKKLSELERRVPV